MAKNFGTRALTLGPEASQPKHSCEERGRARLAHVVADERKRRAVLRQRLEARECERGQRVRRARRGLGPQRVIGHSDRRLHTTARVGMHSCPSQCSRGTSRLAQSH